MGWFMRKDPETREHERIWKQTCEERQDRELALYAELVRLCQTYSVDGKIDKVPGALILQVYEKAKTTALDNEIMGVWDNTKKPEWYERLTINIQTELADDD